MKFNFKKLLLISAAALFFGVGLFQLPQAVGAATTSSYFGLQSMDATGLGHADIRIIIANIIRVALGFLGILAVSLMLYAGYEWMTSGGNEEQIGTAKKILINATIGLAIILSSYSIVAFVMNKLVEATGYTGDGGKCQAQIDAGGFSCDGDCPKCGDCPPGVDCSASESFHIVKNASGGDVCVANYYPIIVFNKDVDLNTLNHFGADKHPDNIQVINLSDSTVVNGYWNFQNDGNTRQVYFTSPDACVGVNSFCLKPNTKYKLVFAKPENIKTQSGVQNLTCNNLYKCDPVEFTTGSKVDTQPPKITVKYPIDGDSFNKNSTVGVVVNYTDDIGLQSLNLNVDNNFIESVKPAKNCEPSGELTINWKAFKFPIGKRNLRLVGIDWANNQGKADLSVNLKPEHCFNNTLDKDLEEKFTFPSPVGDCGGACGACEGDICTQNSDCASGYCEIPVGQSKGVCVNKTRIDYFSLDNGAVGDYVSVFGKYFGANPGHVYFAATTTGQWIEATPVNCGTNFKYWTGNQIIISVPTSTASNGPLKVVTAVGGVNGTDTTGDSWGPQSSFVVTTTSHPGICSISPQSGYEGQSFSVSGKGFGKLADLNLAADSLIFQGSNIKITNWSESLVASLVPVGSGNGDFTVQVKKSGLLSNGIKFSVTGSNPNGPIITGLNMTSTAVGDYLMIYGKNFGSQQGSVIFNKNGNSGNSDVAGSFNFPVECKNNSTWSDSQVLVKIPTGIELNADFSVRVKLFGSNVFSPIDNKFFIHTVAGSAKPGICLVDPASGPVPFSGSNYVNIYGDNLQDANAVWFWKSGAHLDSLSSLASSAVTVVSNNHVTTTPGASVVSGPVLVNSNNNKQSNTLQFSVYDCTKNNNTCNDANNQCCGVGSQNGMCIPKTSTCIGAKRNSGYAWLFSTGGISPVPQVVERCNADTEVGKFLPSPSPSVLWNSGGAVDANKVCQTAVVTVEFNTQLDQLSINPNTVKLFTCDSVNDNQCVKPVEVNTNLIDPDSYVLKVSNNNANQVNHDYLSISLKDNQKWTSSTWYQVVISSSTKSVVTKNKYNESIQFNLAATRPCGSGTAYCFAFRTGVGDCKLKQVVITPSQFWTTVLEEPIRYRSAGGDAYDVTYSGNGLSEQRCIMMNVNGFNWTWSPTSTTYIKRLSTFGTNNRLAQFGAEANTVGIGLPNDSVYINATAATTSVSKTGTSTLTIDLSNPQVVDYEPKCLEACTNALVSATFNVSMSGSNLDTAVKLYKCDDENCLSVKEVVGIKPAIDNKSTNDHRWLKIYNTVDTQKLEANTLYKVVLSTTSSKPAVSDGSQLWSLASALLPQSYSKPFNQEYSWRFRTKKEACTIDRVEVTPKVFTAQKLDDRAVFTAQPYSAPDACSVTGQKLNPFLSAWSWSSSNLQVASIQTFITKGSNPNCSSNCLLKGSDIPSGSASSASPVCGNDIIEAGEDCVSPNKAANCSLNCLTLNKTKKGSEANTQSTDVNASICGNGFIGVDEDCDLGVAPSSALVTSSMLCSGKCLHVGTPLSANWCQDHQADRGGFSVDEFNQACSQSLSRCGDGNIDKNEDIGCDLGKGNHDISCNDRCLKLFRCNPGEVGCSNSGQKQGSSLMYPTPSVCGDGQVGAGEDEACDKVANFVGKINNFVDPWVLAIGQGGGLPSGVPPVQSSDITGVTNNKPGVGKYQVECGWKSDTECSGKYSDPNRGVGDDSCCYARPKLTNVYPGNINAPVGNICINTYIEAGFDSLIDVSTLPGNLLLAKYDSVGNTCATGTEKVDSALIANFGNLQNLAWYQKVWYKVVSFVQNIFGSKVAQASVWCAGADLATPTVVPDGNGGSKIILQLNQALSTSTKYAVVLKQGIKDTKGVRIRNGANGKPLGWQFETGSKLCEVSSVVVKPDHVNFNIANVSTTLEAQALTENSQIIVPVPGYKWLYSWGPKTSDFVSVSNVTTSVNVITSQNKNGEVDVYASAKIIENKFTKQTGLVGTGRSHIIVFLCENPWPPLKQKVGLNGPFSIFPYEDKLGNNDNFSLAENIFDNTPIPPSEVVAAGYFNFSTYYCADNGVSGNIIDDLPYLKPVVHSSSTILGSGQFVTSTIEISQNVADKSTCENDPNIVCSFDNDCTQYTLDMFAKKRVFITGNTGMCVPKNAGSIFYYFDSNNLPLTCTVDKDCTDALVTNQPFSNFYNGGGGISVSCIGLNNYGAVKVNSVCVAHTKVVTSTIQQPTAKPFNALKRFFFTSNKNADAIGVQILSNPNHLTARQWFELDKKLGGQGFKALEGLQDIQVDGYDAVSDGNNVYVNALNFNSTAKDVGNLYTNTYLFSINYNANEETRKVFEQFIKNLKFNINLTNDKRCIVPGQGPSDDSLECISDFDCVSSSTPGQTCSSQKDKLQRDFQRLQDMGQIFSALDSYSKKNSNTYPDLKAGTYLTGQTVSTWPSWSVLGNAVGVALPPDPINQLGIGGTCASSTGAFCVSDNDCVGQNPIGQKCILHDSTTGWSTANQRFSFACSPDSLAYRYMSTSTSSTLPGASGYTVKMHWEIIGLSQGLNILNKTNLFNDFIPDSATSKFDFNSNTGICNQSQEISSLVVGTCGDGKVGKGEACDPPGAIKWNLNSCDGVGVSSSTPLSGDICSSACQWTANATSTTCGKKLSKCGNGIKEIGENCDEGVLNGKYDHCALDCSGFAGKCGNGTLESDYEVCDTKFNYSGSCVGGVRNGQKCSESSDCNYACIFAPYDPFSSIVDASKISLPFSSPTYNCTFQFLPSIGSNNDGVCQTVQQTGIKYGNKTKTESCGASCQAYGPYCGDGEVQTQFGEECDGNVTCSIESNSGNRICGSNCKWRNLAAILDYRFEDIFVYNSKSFAINSASNTQMSMGAYCAGASCPSPVAGIKNKGMSFDGSSDYFIVDHNSSFDINELTIAAWINVDSGSSDGYHTILSKQDDKATSNERDYNFYIVKSGSKVVKLHLYSGPPPSSTSSLIFGVNDIAVDFPVDEWHFVAVTVDSDRNVKYYVDNQLKGVGLKNGSVNTKANNPYKIWIGKADNYFKGKMDELQLYGRALSEMEIKDLYTNSANFCNLYTAPVAAEAPASCGNGKVDEGEACDKGVQNGIACGSSYNKSCTYCSANCSNIITVNALGYCGDGIINNNSPEKCEVDSIGSLVSFATSSGTGNDFNLSRGLSTFNTIYPNHGGYKVLQCYDEFNTTLNVSSTYFYSQFLAGKIDAKDNLVGKVGEKSCADNCGIGSTNPVQSGCVACGLKENGTVISGAIINVLDPNNNKMNALVAFEKDANNEQQRGTMDLVYAPDNVAAVSNFGKYSVGYKYMDEDKTNLSNMKSYTLAPGWGNSNDQAKVESNPVCSDEKFDKLEGKHYQLLINADGSNEHAIDFQVFGAATPDAYNLLLSPVIASSQVNKGASVVTKARPNDVRVVVSWVGKDANQFSGGFLRPNLNPSITTMAMANGVGIDYFDSPSDNGVWFHGAGQGNTSNVKAYTIDTSLISGSSYSFFVQLNSASGGIAQNGKDAKLKVEIYAPESKHVGENDDVYRHFAKPIKTFYISQALGSSNSDALYWHVFDITKEATVAAEYASHFYVGGQFNSIRTEIKPKY